MAAEDVLHDLGAISMMSSDSQAMGRVGEVITRTWQTAHVMKEARGALPRRHGRPRQPPHPPLRREVHDQPGECARHRRPRRIDRSRQDGRPGAVDAGVLRRQAGPDHQGRLDRAALMGDPNASIPTPEPVRYRPMFGALGARGHTLTATFVSQRVARRRASAGRAAASLLPVREHAPDRQARHGC